MRIELDIDLRPEPPTPKPKPDAAPVSPEEKLCRYREDQFLRRVALARVIEEKISAGEFRDMADAAERCRVSRTRMSKAVAWRG